MRVSIIAAMSDNGVIGRDGRLPWHLADDLKRFRELTMGHTVVMGRKTWESIGRPLPGRRIVVVSRQRDYRPEGVAAAASLEDALTIAESAGDDEAFIAGGAEIYRLALPRADRLYLTRVHTNVTGDTYFPNVEWPNWRRINSQQRPADNHNELPFTMETYELAKTLPEN